MNVINPGFSNVIDLWLFDMPMALFYIALSVWLLIKGLTNGSAVEDTRSSDPGVL